MKVYFITDDALSTIKANLASYLQYFEEETNEALVAAVKETSQEETIFKATAYDIPDNFEEVLLQNAPNKNDGKNVEFVHSLLKDLPPTIACDERFWAGLAIHSCWRFVRKRWDMEKKLTVNGVQAHFLFKSSQKVGFVRNALSRLWWIGHLTYDSTREDPYELTKLVCENSDYVQNLFERDFSNSFNVLRTLVLAIRDIRSEYNLTNYPQRLIREICKYVNLLGGIYILETLPEEVFINKIRAKAKKHQDTETNTVSRPSLLKRLLSKKLINQ